ncbi:MAG: ATP-binding protein [Victivallales bacterium]
MIDKNKIKEILVDQRDEANAIIRNCDVSRDLEPEIKEGLEDNLVKVISGVRRCGKSVLAHRILQGKQYGYVNFDDERLVSVRAEELNLFLESLLEINPGMRFILLDEIQNVSGWELFVNRLQRNGYRVIITGSNAHLLSRELGTHLTGRHCVYEVYPYSFSEYLRMRKICFEEKEPYSTRTRSVLSATFSEYFELGGFPEITRIVNRNAYLQDLYDKVLSQDIAMRHGVRYIKTLKDIAQYVASNYSSKLSYQNVKNAFSLGSIHTIKNYIQYMQDAYLFFSVEAFSHKPKEKVRLPRKMYGVDISLVRALSTSGQKNEGRFLENLVYVEMLRRRKTVHYYSDPQNKYEVDFICNDPGTNDVSLLQVCTDVRVAETKERELRALLSARKSFKGGADSSMKIITMDYKSTEIVSGINVEYIPAWEWLLFP